MLFIILCVFCTAGCVRKQKLPVTVEFRQSLLGEGVVAVVKNDTSTQMKVLITGSNRTTKQRKTWAVLLRPHGCKEIGWVQGWAFVQGETIIIEHEGYSPKQIVVP